MWKYLSSRTVWGAALIAGAQIVSDPHNVNNYMNALGALLAGVGVRGAIANVEQQQDAAK